MAVLNKIRQRSVFLIIIIALALFSFVLADVIRNGGFSSNKSQTVVATVNGKDMSRQEFAEKVDAYQRQVGPNVSSTQAVNTVWERELRAALLDEQYEALGLTVEADELSGALSDALVDNPTFQDENGFYSEARLKEYVASLKGNATAQTQWDNYIDGLKNSILETKYMNMVKGGLAVTNAEGERQYRYENDKVNIEYLYVPYTSIADDEVPITDAEIATYIKNNPSDFEIDGQVDIQYVSFSEEASQADIDFAQEDISKFLLQRVEFSDTIPGFANVTDHQAYINANSDQAFVDRWMYKNDYPATLKDTLSGMNVGSVYGPYKSDNTYNLTKVIAKRQLPDSVKARHILIPFGLNATDSITRTNEEAKVTADSILSIVRGNRGKFASLVTAISSDKGSIDKGGEYDYYPYNQMVEPFRDFTFEGKKGDIGIAETRFGYHIIEVLGQKNMQDVIKVATITKEIETSEATLNDTFSKAANFEVAARGDGFDAALTAQALTAKPVNKIGELDANIPGVGQNRRLVNWAFNEDTEVGDVIKEKTDDGYIVAQLTRRSPKGLMTSVDASATVTPILRNKKKAEMIRTSASGTTLEEIASSKAVRVQNATALTMAAPTIPGAGAEPKVVGAAFGTEDGQMSNFIEGAKGVYKVRVLSKNPAPELQSYASFAKQANDAIVPQMNNNVYQALKKSAKVEDNRAAFY